MSKANGFLPLRRGLWEHVRDGRMSITQALAFIYICSQADTRSGVWKGCAKALASELGIAERTARDVLEKMQEGDYIRRFAMPGRHSCYPILVHKFEITQGKHNGEQLNALDSKSPTGLAYFSREQSVEQDGKQSVQHGAAQRRIDNRNKTREKNPAAKNAPLANPRHKAAFDLCFEAYKLRYGARPTWAGREAKALQVFLGAHPQISADEILRRYRNFLDSSDRYHSEKHGSLLHLLSSFDVFADGPLVAFPQKGAINADQRTRDNLRAAGFLQ